MTEPSTLLKKLQVKAGDRLWLINVPREIAEMLTAGAEVEISHAGEGCTGVLAFCESAAEVASFAAQIEERLPPDGLLWFAYRKGHSAFNRDTGWESLTAIGQRPVRQIAIDEIWSAVRFRPAARVKALPRSRFA